MTLEYLLYRSTGRIEQFGDDCTNILRVARLRNADLGLTGFLHAEDGVFVQWLEGPAKALNQVAELILSDRRHSGITVFGRGPVITRQFPDWSMGFSNGEKAPLFDWLVESDANSHDHRAFGNSLHQFLLHCAA